MKKIISLSALALVGASVALAQTQVDRTEGSLTTIGGWDFNGASGSSVTSINARYNQQYSPLFTAGNGVSPGDSDYGTMFLTTNGGSFGSARGLNSTNAPSYDLLSTDGLQVSNNSLGDQATNAKSMLLSLSTASDNARASFKISTLTTFDSFTSINLAYSARNQGSANATISWSYSLNGTSFTAISGTSQVLANAASFSVYTADFSAVEAIEGVETLYIGLEYSEAAAGGSVFLDNLAIYGTAAAIAIPEPSAFATLAGVAALGLVASRRRRSSK